MIQSKGKYFWEVRDSKTGEVLRTGEQENTVPDDYWDTVTNYYKCWHPTYADRLMIGLCTHNTPIDFEGQHPKKLGLIAGKVHIAMESPNRNGYRVDPNNTPEEITVDYNFGPPTSQTTYTAMTIRYNYNGMYLISYAELTTPITQNTNENIFIKYKLTLTAPDFSSSDTLPNNPYVRTWMADKFGWLNWQCIVPMRGIEARLTPYLPPEDPNNIAVAVGSTTNLGRTHEKGDGVNKSRFCVDFGSTLSEGTSVGAIGAIVYRGRNAHDANNYDQNDLTFGHSKPKLKPTIGRAFKHGEGLGRAGTWYSSLSSAPNSKGTVTFSGTPENKIPTAYHVIYEKTGEAAEDGSTQGSYRLGINTSSRFEFNQMRSITKNMAGDPSMRNGAPGSIDIGNNQRVSAIVNGGIDINTFYNVLYDRTVAIINAPDERIYSIQRESWDDPYVICSWNLYTIESSVVHAEFGGEFGDSIKFSGYEKIGDIIYIATSKGLYSFDLVSHTIETIDITEALSTDITDIVVDPDTDKLWFGHIGGLSVFDTTTGSIESTYGATELAGLSTNQLHITSGQLFIKGGVLIRGGRCSYTQISDSTDYGSSRVVRDYEEVWSLDISSGAVHSILSGRRDILAINQLEAHKVAILTGYKGKPTLRIFTFSESNEAWEETDSILSTVLPIAGSSSEPLGSETQLIETGANKLSWFFYSNYRNIINTYYASGRLDIDLDTGVFAVSLLTGDRWRDHYTGRGTSVRKTASKYERNEHVRNSMFNTSKKLVYLDAGGPLYVPISNSFCAVNNYYSGPYSNNNTHLGVIMYGWDGSRWVQGLDTPRPITPGEHELLMGVKCQFSNAAGVAWDQQFIANEDTACLTAQTDVKDNLQTYSVKSCFYYCNSKEHEHILPVPDAVDGYATITIPEVSDPNFRDYNIYKAAADAGYGMSVYNVTDDVEMTWVADKNAQQESEYYPTCPDGKIRFHANMAGKSVKVKYVATYY